MAGQDNRPPQRSCSPCKLGNYSKRVSPTIVPSRKECRAVPRISFSFLRCEHRCERIRKCERDNWTLKLDSVSRERKNRSRGNSRYYNVLVQGISFRKSTCKIPVYLLSDCPRFYASFTERMKREVFSTLLLKHESKEFYSEYRRNSLFEILIE